MRPGGDNWSWLARCSVPLPPGTGEWLGLVSHSQRRDPLACWLSTQCVRRWRRHARMYISPLTSLHHNLMVPPPSLFAVILQLLEPVPLLSTKCFRFERINIHSIDLFSELTGKKQTVCQGINPDRSVALLCFIVKTARQREEYAYADTHTQSKTPIKC